MLERNGEPFFVGKDVAVILGYAKPENAIATHVDDEDKTTTLIQGSGSNYKSNAVIINESGLYSLILRSQLPNAKKFKRWVTAEVLPSIRKHGLYAVDEVLNNPDILINALQALKEEREKRASLELETAIQRQQIAEMNPKVCYYDKVLACKELVKVTVIAKDYGRSARWLNEKLRELKVQYKQGEQWILYQKYAQQGYTQSYTHTYTKPSGEEGSSMITKWTQKGRLFIYDLLKKEGILPVCEVNG